MPIVRIRSYWVVTKYQENLKQMSIVRTKCISISVGSEGPRSAVVDTKCIYLFIYFIKNVFFALFSLVIYDYCPLAR